MTNINRIDDTDSTTNLAFGLEDGKRLFGGLRECLNNAFQLN